MSIRALLFGSCSCQYSISLKCNFFQKGHVELAMLLLERGANIEEVNDEGYTPLMEAAREGHEEMVALLLSQGADINAQTDETQETALTLVFLFIYLDLQID